MVIYHSKLHATLKRNLQLLPAIKGLTLLLAAHIPDEYEHLVRYYGCYSNLGYSGSAMLQLNPLKLSPRCILMNPPLALALMNCSYLSP